MKTTLRLLIALLLLLVSGGLFSQTLVNEEWVDSSGTPCYKYNFVTGTTDADGNIIIADNGQNDTGENFVITKYDEYGNELWQNIYNNEFAYYGFGTGIVTAGNDIYVTGISTDTTGSEQTFFTMRLGADGNVMWINYYEGSYGGYCIPTQIATRDSSVYVCGVEQTGLLNSEITLLQYDSSGNQIWVQHWDTTGYNIPVALFASELYFDLDGDNILITVANGTGPDSYNLLLLYCNNDGLINRVIGYDAGVGVMSSIVGVEEDAYQNMYVAGVFDTMGTQMMKLVVFIYNGWTWEQIYLAPGSIATVPTGLAVDPVTGFMAVSATVTKADGGQDAVAFAFLDDYNTDTLTTLWNQKVSAANPAQVAEANDVALDNKDNVYITGTTTVGTQLKYLTQSYNSSGSPLWQKTYSRCSTCNDIGQDIMLDNNESVIVSGISMGLTDTTYATVAYAQWSPAACAESVNPPHGYAVSDCPYITYNFENGQLTASGTDTFVEFDIYANQSDSTAPFSGSTIYFTYSTDVFGQNVVDSSNITITKGDITADSTNYFFAVHDTLLPSGAIPANGGEVALTITSGDSTRLYDIADTFQWLCHVKMKMKKKATLQIWYDQFFMQNLSLYNNEGSNQYNYVQTGGVLAMNSDDAATLYFSLTDFTATATTLTCNLWALADQQVDMYEANCQISYHNNSIADWPTKDLTNPSSSWITDPSGPYGYSENKRIPGEYTFDVQQIDGNDDEPILHTWPTTSADFCSNIELYGEIFFGLTFDIVDCTKDPDLGILLGGSTSTQNTYYLNDIVTNFNIIQCGAGLHGCFCANPIGLRGDCSANGVASLENNTVINVYPNPFSNSVIINFTLVQDASTRLTVENSIGQIVYATSFGDLGAGNFSREINLPNNISNGVYILKINVNNELNVIKLIKD